MAAGHQHKNTERNGLYHTLSENSWVLEEGEKWRYVLCENSHKEGLTVGWGRRREK